VERRDKYQMGEAVRRSGVRAVKQARATQWEDVSEFVKDNPEPFKIIIKPIRSAGSDCVYLCESLKDLKSKFEGMIGQINQLGVSNLAVVVQEYLEGNEYVVDTVSRDGVHKLACIWVYDKREANGAKFVYFGMRIVDAYSEKGQKLFEYTKGVLDALGIRNGPGHAEVMWTTTGPCLVEVGARPHGAEGTFIPIADKCIGYNQVRMTVDAYCDEKAFGTYPDLPPLKYGHGAIIDLVCYKTGTLKCIGKKEYDAIAALSTFVSFNMLPKPGDKVSKTVDCFTAAGSVSLFGPSLDDIDRDVKVIRDAELKNLFTV